MKKAILILALSLPAAASAVTPLWLRDVKIAPDGRNIAFCYKGDIYTVPISHGEGRFLASEELVKALAANGQIATQYVDLDGCATMNAAFNPNGSLCAIEGITSPDGRVLGKMGHTERIGKNLYRNVPGQYEMELFTSAVRYFK